MPHLPQGTFRPTTDGDDVNDRSSVGLIDYGRMRDLTPPLTEKDLQDLEAMASGDREWGWYIDHVPVLVAEIRKLRGGAE